MSVCECGMYLGLGSCECAKPNKCHQHGVNFTEECPFCQLDGGSALSRQEGGDHYKSKAIQPVQYCMANGIGFMEGSVIKYVTRWRDKGGVQDLKKAKHFLELLIEYEEGGI